MYFINPWSLATWPKQLDRRDYWVIDNCVNKSLLGVGCMKWVTSVGSTLEQDASSADAGSAGGETQDKKRQAGAEHRSAPPLKQTRLREHQSGNGSAHEKKARKLEEQVSDPALREEREAESAESIAQATSECVAQGRFLSPNANDYDSVAGWVRCYVDYIDNQHKAFMLGQQQIQVNPTNGLKNKITS